MVQIRKITPSTALSQNVPIVDPGGGAFGMLADAMSSAAKILQPIAIQDEQAAGAEAGHQMAKAQMGAGQSPVSQPIAWANAIGTMESGGRYDAVGPDTGKGRALGKYQVMDSNVGPWSQEVLGRTLTEDQFLKDPDSQDKIFHAKFGGFVAQTGSPEDAASMWFSGRPIAAAGNAQDVTGTTVPEYVRKFSSLVASQSTPQPTMVRTSDGDLQPRLYSPASGPILQAYNAAAGTAYMSDMLMRGQTDLLNMSNDMKDNPQAFASAAGQYLDTAVKSAPAMMRADLRLKLQDQVQQRYLGMLDEQHQQVQQRAVNSTTALSEKYSDDLSRALAADDSAGADTAKTNLQQVLRAKENLPGSVWTPAQSQWLMQQAEDRALVLRREQQSQLKTQATQQFDTIIEARKNGQSAANEGDLSDPKMVAANPQKAAEAAAYVHFGNFMPTFKQASPAQQQEVVDSLMKQPVTASYQVDMTKIAQESMKASITAWRADPVKQASAVMNTPPPALPDFSVTDPKAIVTSLTARRDYMNDLQANGYFPTKVYLSDDEAKQLGVMMGKATPPELRLAMATAIVKGFGNDAPTLFRQIKNDDPVTLHAGMLLSHGGDQATALSMMRGQDLIDQGAVQLPAIGDTVKAFSPQMQKVLNDAGVAPDQQGQLLKVAVAIYADGRNTDKSAMPGLMSQAMQKALGQSKDASGRVTGGIQNIGGNDTLLPPGMAPQDVNAAMTRAFYSLKPGGNDRVFAPDLPVDQAIWERSSRDGSPPMLGGKPLPANLFRDGHVQILPVDGSRYRIEVQMGGTPVEARDSGGHIFIFDLKKLVGQ